MDVISGVMAAINQQDAAADFSKRVGAPPARQVADAGFGQQLVASSPRPITPYSKAMLGLEGSLTTKIVDAMMPHSKNGLFGKGLAGETYRGFAVDQLGATLASADLLHFNRVARVPDATAASVPDSATDKGVVTSTGEKS